VSVTQIARQVLKELLWHRGRGRCGICSAPVEIDVLSVDHIVPRSMGGLDVLDNLQAAHARCNYGKGGANRLPGARRSRRKPRATNPDIVEGLTVREVAARLRMNEEVIRRMLRDGRLVGVRPAGRRAGWRIPASELARLLRR
jgi:excisionase family DNA binding protein